MRSKLSTIKSISCAKCVKSLNKEYTTPENYIRQRDWLFFIMCPWPARGGNDTSVGSAAADVSTNANDLEI